MGQMRQQRRRHAVRIGFEHRRQSTAEPDARRASTSRELAHSARSVRSCRRLFARVAPGGVEASAIPRLPGHHFVNGRPSKLPAAARQQVQRGVAGNTALERGTKIDDEDEKSR